MPRQLEFDIEAARATIMSEFWKRGYAGTSLNDLERATFLVRTSLYNTFGSKPDMFLDSLKLYHAMIETQIDTMTQGRGIEALADVIGAMMEGAGKAATQPEGCLMVMAATQSRTIEPRHLHCVRAYRRMLVDKARLVLERDKEAGKLASHIDPEGAAEFLICTVWGALAAQCLGADGPPAATGTATLNSVLESWKSAALVN